MNILHICSIGNNKTSGISNVVPYHFLFQKKFASVSIINCNKNRIQLLENETNYYNLEDINNNVANLREIDKTDIAIFHGVYIAEYIKIYKWLRKNKIPYVIIPHGSLTKDAQRIKWIKKKVGNILCFNNFIDNAIEIQYLSKSEADMSKEFKKAFFIKGNGMNNPQIRKKNFETDGIKIVYVGRYAIYHKGIDRLIDACGLISEYMVEHKITLDLYGAGNDGKDKVKELVKKNKLEEIIKVYDAIFDEEKYKRVLEHDIFIQTSRLEGQPLGIMEAMFLGMPVIVSEGTTFGRIVEENKCGYVGNSSKEISNKIIECCEKKSSLPTMSNNAYEYANEHFLWDSIAKETLNEYERIIKEKEV